MGLAVRTASHRVLGLGRGWKVQQFGQGGGAGPVHGGAHGHLDGF